MSAVVEDLSRAGRGADYGPWRRRHGEHFARHGLPTTRLENWKYVSLRDFEGSPGRPARPAPVQGEDLGATVFPAAAGRIVFVDGYYRPDLAELERLPAEVSVSAAPADEAGELQGFESVLGRDYAAPDESLAALAASAAAHRVELVARRGARLVQPLHVVFVSTATGGNAIANAHLLVRAEAGASVDLVEHHLALGPSDCLTNTLVSVELDADSALEHLRLQACGDGAALVTRTDVHQRRGSAYRYIGFDVGGRLVRHDVHCRLAEPGSEARLLGLYALSGHRLVDNHTRVDHVAPDTRSDEFFKGVLDGRTRGVFNGKVVVHGGAAQVDAQQVNRNLLLSERAEIDTKPELEIYADDVRCAHGATVGQLDEKQLFYLRSRGIPGEAARRLLVDAFCREILDRVPGQGLRDWLEEQLVDRLPGGAGGQAARDR